MSDFKIHYDDAEDILYLGKEGTENEVIELAPGIVLELDEERKVIGIELLNASSLFRDVIRPMVRKLRAA